MLRYATRRLLWSIPVLLIASVLVFVAIKATTDPSAIRAPGVRAEDVQRYREQLGLDKPAIQQYTTWLGNFLTGDLGISLKTRQPVWPELRTAMANSLQLGLLAFSISITFGIVIGTLSATRQYSIFDGLTTGVSFLGLSIPPFFFGLILQIILVLQWNVWFGDGSTPFFTSRMNSPGVDGFGWDRFMHMILPALTVAVQGMAIYSRYMRASMLETLNSDYLRTARAKGLRERRRHPPRPAQRADPGDDARRARGRGDPRRARDQRADLRVARNGHLLPHRPRRRRLRQGVAVDDDRGRLGDRAQPRRRPARRCPRPPDPAWLRSSPATPSPNPRCRRPPAPCPPPVRGWRRSPSRPDVWRGAASVATSWRWRPPSC
jgi:peptide/nickel transport system permease protein